MRIGHLLAPLMALGFALSSSAPALAAGGVAGSYSIDLAASDNVEKAIDKAVAPMNFVVKAIARGRLQKVNQPYHHIVIGTGSKLSVQTDARAPIAAASGATIKWTRPEDGEKLDVTMRLAGNRLEEDFVSPDGKRVNVFEPSADGKKLVMAVTVTSPRLPKPLTYRIAYKREK